MTTIAYKDGVLAADRQISWGGEKLGETTKVHKRKKDGALIAAAGVLSFAQAYIAWFLKGERGKAPSMGSGEDTANALIIRPNGMIESVGSLGVSKFTAPIFAVGTGDGYALGAMAAGKTAAEAVEIASRYDVGTSNSIDTVTL